MKKYIVVVNLRRLTKEAYVSLQAIKSQGFCVLLISKEIPEFCKAIVDIFVSTDTLNYDLTISTVKQLAKLHCIVGVTAFTETAVEISSYIAQELDLPGNPVDAVIYSRNKYAMRKKLANANVPQVPHLHVKNESQLNEAIKAIGYPLIAKPINTSGSTGIFYLTSDKDIRNFSENSSKISNPSYDPMSRTNSIEFILEKYIGGSEVSVEGFVFDNEVIIYGITDKLTTDDYKIEYQHIFPSSFSDSQKNIIHETVKKIISCLEFNYCSFHLEGKLHENKFYMIEVATRPAGGYIASHLISNATNENYYEDLVKIAVGIKPTSQYRAKSYSGVRFVLAQQEGIFSSVYNWSYITQHPLVSSLFIETEIGSRILLPPKDYRLLRLYAYICSGNTYQEVENSLSEIANNSKPIIVE